MNLHQESHSSHELIHISELDDIKFALSHDSGSYVAPHWHNSLELICILSGELEVTVNGDTTLLQTNDILLINSKTLHGTKCVKRNDAILLLFPYPFIKKYIPNINNLFFTLNTRTNPPQLQPELNHVRDLLNQMLSLHMDTQEGNRLRFTSLLFELLYVVHHNFKIELLLSDANKRTKNLDKLEPIFQYTKAHYKTPISISEISTVANLQPEYFCRFFKKNMGITYLEYLNEVRLSFIYQGLLTTDLPVTRLLETHGFTNYKLFRRMFRDHFHGTPGEIRRNSRGPLPDKHNFSEIDKQLINLQNYI